MKLFITGYARHGKDSAAKIIHDLYGLTFESSSHFCMNLFLRERLREVYGLEYPTAEACFEDRMNHRAKWAVEIAKYNQDDPARLSRAIFEEYDIYVGIRSKVELDAARHLADLVLWIDRPGWEEEAKSSNTLDPGVADIVISATNLDEMQLKIQRLFAAFEGFWKEV